MQAAERPIQIDKAGRDPDDLGPALVGCFSDFDCPPSHFSQRPKARACIAVLGQLIELGFSALDLRCRGIVKLGAIGRPLYVLGIASNCRRCQRL